MIQPVKRCTFSCAPAPVPSPKTVFAVLSLALSLAALSLGAAGCRVKGTENPEAENDNRYEMDLDPNLDAGPPVEAPDAGDEVPSSTLDAGHGAETGTDAGAGSGTGRQIDAGARRKPPRKPRCGDGVVNGREQCERGVRIRKTCRSLGYYGGKLRCRRCRYDTRWCTRRPQRIYRRGRGSCPYVFLWDGKRYHYHGDLSGSVLGHGLKFFKTAYYGDNIYKLGRFKAVGGEYRMKLREVIFEASYFDKAALLLVDAPKGYEVFNKWSFTSQLNRKPDLGFVTVKNKRPPRSARLTDGTSVLKQVRRADGVPVPVGKKDLTRVVLDFGAIKNPKHAKLIITAWGFYGDLRGHQRPPYSSGTVIETRDARGRWKVRKVAGKCAGDAKSWAIDIGGLVKKNDTRIRLTLAHLPSVLDVLDAIAMDDSPPVKIKVTKVFPSVATLRFGGGAKFTPSSLKNRIQAKDVKRPLIKEAYMKGAFTRFGDVLPLLKKSDDRFVVMAHGDSLRLRFAAPRRHRINGQKTTRHAFLLADVFYTLKYHPFKKLTDDIAPIPFHGMKSYPYPPAEWPYKNDADYKRYMKKWNTRIHR